MDLVCPPCRKKLRAYGNVVVVENDFENLKEDLEQLTEDFGEVKKELEKVITQNKQKTRETRLHQTKLSSLESEMNEMRLNHQSQMNEMHSSHQSQMNDLRATLAKDRKQKQNIDLTRLFDKYFATHVSLQSQTVGEYIKSAKGDQAKQDSLSKALGFDFSVVERIHNTIRRQRNRHVRIMLPEDFEAESAIDDIQDYHMLNAFRIIFADVYQ